MYALKYVSRYYLARSYAHWFTVPTFAGLILLDEVCYARPNVLMI